MDYQLHDFIPLYNKVQTQNFDNDINTLAEFTKYALPKEEPFPQHPGDLMLHQKLISNFINPHTPYNGLLLVHEMGTGKTCTAVAVAEEFIKSAPLSNSGEFPITTIKNIIVLTKGKGLHSNFINEVANVCTQNQYLEGIDQYVKNRDMRIRKNVKVNYNFNTFEIFAKSLAKISDREKIKTYENTLFIVDEAHNLRASSDVEENNIYREIATFFDLLQNKKILLLTGTPMKDKPEEIVDLLNLILKNKLTTDDLTNEQRFKDKVSGYVSYLRAMMSDVDRKEEGEMIGSLKHFKVYQVVMHKFQSEIYTLAKKKDEEERSIFNHSRQTSSIVFPDKTYGKHGFEKNIIQTSTGYKFASSRIREELQQNLHKYSAKYADLLEKLNKDYFSGRLSFVFSEFVKGSGLIVLSLILELNGYTRATSTSNLFQPQKRYAIFTNETSTDAQTRKLISVCNNSKNMKGEYISTILGSRVIMEGFTFKNIQSEYIITPHWNYSETSQIIARGLRLGSHNDLIKSGFVPEVKIYQYVALPLRFEGSTTQRLPLVDKANSIDLYMYEISETKDFQIQKVIRTLKEAAFDCVLTKKRNTVMNSKLENTRSCEYSKCDYKCENSKNVGKTYPVQDYDRNYKLLYFKSSPEYLKLKNIIIQNAIHAPFTVEEIMKQTNHSHFEVMSVLQDLLNFQEILLSRPEGSYYLSNTKNLFYISNNPPLAWNTNNINNYDDENDPSLLNFYSTYTTVFSGKSIDELIYNNQKNFMVSLINKIFTSKNLTELQKYIVQLPLYLQEKLLCYSISSKNKNISNNFIRDMILNNYRLYYKINDKNAFIWLNSEEYKCNPNLEDYNSWKPCNSTEQKNIEKMKKERTLTKVTNNPYGYIGLINKSSNDFCLKKTDQDEESADKRKKNVGKRCQNWKKKELIDLVSNRLKVDPDEDFDFDQSDASNMRKDPKFDNLLSADNGTLKDYKRVAFWNAQDVNYLCNKIMYNFIDQKLVIDDPNCGTSKKLR